VQRAPRSVLHPTPVSWWCAQRRLLLESRFAPVNKDHASGSRNT
jgi:hypothetical protein